jgi:hypothetical protein
VYDAEGGRHQAFYSPLRDTIVMGELVRSHERIQIEQSLKYSAAEAQVLWQRAGMTEIAQWRRREEYGELIYAAFHSLHQGLRPRTSPFQRSHMLGCRYPTLWNTWGQSYDTPRCK